MKLIEIRNIEDELEIADDFIHSWDYDSSYQKEHFNNKEKIRNDFNITLRRYPCRVNRTVYRGLAFHTLKELQKFKETTHNFTVLTDPAPSSWTLDKTQAFIFGSMDTAGNQEEYTSDEPKFGVIISLKTFKGNFVDTSKYGLNEIISGPLVNVPIKLIKSTV